MTRVPAERSRRLDRIGPAIGVAAIHLLIGYGLLVGMRVQSPGPPADDLTSLILVELTPPLPREPVPPTKTARRIGAKSAPKGPPLPKMVEAPIPAPPPPLIVAAPPVVSGGGSGGAGSGSSDGVGNGEGFSSARQIRGRFRNSDFPASARKAGRLKIGVRYAVGPAGRVDHCEIIEPSGYPEVDAMTCRVIVDRYRFKPALDGEGVAVTEVMEEDYSWVMD